jgi:long-chain fatty acid transport protein
MKKIRIYLFVVGFVLLFNSNVLANGLNLNSLGSKALTMGGAFVGLADDYSAIFWNPAGIAQFKEKYIGFYGTDIIPSGSYAFSLGPLPVVDAETVTKHYLGGLAAFYYPIGEDVVAGIGVYTPSGLGSEWDGADFAGIAANNPNLKWKSKIGLVTIAPAVAFSINEQVSIGAALNINYGMFDVAFHAGAAEVPVPPYEVDLAQYEESMKGWGFGATLGILVKPSEMFSIGATFRTASKVSMDGEASIPNLSLIGAALGISLNPSTDLERDLTWPMWLAFGVAVKPLDALTLTGDIQFTQWSKIDIIRTEYKDPYWQILLADDTDRPMHWDNAVQIRFGAEYILKTWAFRGGYYWDPSPAPNKTMNVLLPSFDFNVLTAGIGYALDGIQIDFGIEYLMGKERDVDVLKTQIDPEWETAMPGIYNMNVVVPNISVSYRF